MRHTVDIGLENNFQRGVPYRSSLQDLNSVSRVRCRFAIIFFLYSFFETILKRIDLLHRTMEKMHSFEITDIEVPCNHQAHNQMGRLHQCFGHDTINRLYPGDRHSLV